MSNVIDAKSAFRARGGPLPPSEGLAARIERCRKVALADRHVFASNLGKLATRIEPARPLAGAQAMFEAADRTTQWPKRKRLVRLPGEDCPTATGKGDYEATPGHYIALAKAAGRLLARSRGLDDPSRDIREAVRALATGSSFAPVYEPVSLGEKSVLSLLDEFAAAIAKKVAESTRLTDLWLALRQSPFAPRAIESLEEAVALEASALGRASLFAAPEPGLPHGARFDAIANTFWAEPAVKVGTFALDWNTRMFVLPPALAFALDDPTIQDGQGMVNRWLTTVGHGPVEEHGLPEVAYTDEGGYGWHEVTLRPLYIAELRIVPGAEYRPKLQLEVRGLQDRGWHGRACVAYHPDWSVQAQLEAALAGTTGNPGAHLLIGQTPKNYLYSIELPESFRPDLEPGQSARRVFGLIEANPDFDMPFPAEEDVDAGDASGWMENGLLAPFFLGDHTFHPAVEVPVGYAVPAKPGSLAAAILLNLRYGDDEGRIDRMLVARAHELATKGLRFQEALIDEYREALGRVGAPESPTTEPTKA